MATTDRLQTFATNASAAVNSGATVRVGSDGINIGTPRDLAQGQSIYLVITVTTAFAGGSSDLQLVSSNTNPVPTDGSAKVHWRSGAITAANLPARRRFVVELPTDNTDYNQFLALLNTGSVSNVTAGAVTAFLSTDKMGWRSYPEANS